MTWEAGTSGARTPPAQALDTSHRDFRRSTGVAAWSESAGRWGGPIAPSLFQFGHASPPGQPAESCNGSIGFRVRSHNAYVLVFASSSAHAVASPEFACLSPRGVAHPPDSMNSLCFHDSIF
jgi:hypothetical protein